MKIFIVGLGLIGASYATKLQAQGHEIYGYDQQSDVRKKALMQGVIKSDTIELIKDCDLIILALYPRANITFMQTHKHLFKASQIITDVSGVKAPMVDAIEGLLPSDYQYISHHPMAGSEKPGYDAKDANLFMNATMIITKTQSTTDKSIKVIKHLARELGFKKTLITSPNTHDALIAYTSQLPHALAIALINANTLKDSFEYSANSYRDLTRIASINATMWSELFTTNKTALSQELDKMITELQTIKDHIDTNDIDALKAYMLKAKERRDSLGNNSN